VISRLLRAVFGVGAVPAEAGRARVRAKIPGAGAEDLLLLDDLLGIRDPETVLPDITPEARRRRLVKLIESVALHRAEPALYVVEDAHWIDSVSEALLADFAAAVPRMRAMLLVIYRPEYAGTLSSITGSHQLSLVPLDDSHTAELVGALLGPDPSVLGLAVVIAERAAGLPFAAEEIVRDLAERGVLEGLPGSYVCVRPQADIQVPASVQAIISARIDRLTATAKRTLNAAAVIGLRFDQQLLESLMESTDLMPLIEAELIEQIAFTPQARYAFCHPLIQAVAYESQLKSGRSELHRRVAAVLQRTHGRYTGQEAAIVATQYAAAGDLRDAFDWHMQAATWYGTRDIRAARKSWELARDVADRLPDDEPERLAMRIGPRAMLCGSTFQVGGTPSDTGFDELRELTTAAGDKRSLVLGMAGHLTALTFNSRNSEDAEVASEFATLVESIGDPALTVGLFYAGAQAKWEAGQASESLRLTQRVIDIADGDATMGDFLIGSPLAFALTVKGAAGMFLGRGGWRDDMEAGIALVRAVDEGAAPFAHLYKYQAALQNGAVLPTAADVARASEDMELVEQSGNNTALAYALLNRATTLIHTDANRAPGLECLTRARELFVAEKLTVSLRRMVDIEFARERARSGDVDAAIDSATTVLDEQFECGEVIFRGPATAVLVEALLSRGSAADLEAAHHAVDRLAAVPTEPGFVLFELPVLRLRSLLARARRDEAGHHRFTQRCLTLAREAGYEAYLG